MKLTTILVLGVFVVAAILLLAWGLPRGRTKEAPWRWYFGILILAASVGGWPIIYVGLSGRDLEMVWILVWTATAWTFGAGLDQLQRSFRPASPLKIRHW